MKKECPNCGGDLEMANPTGYCSHIYYPEACEICQKMQEEEDDSNDSED